ncbi:MAG TPA: ATP-binding protein [Puia sp.]|nr:ATP-binding protein [Puia sp.]
MGRNKAETATRGLSLRNLSIRLQLPLLTCLLLLILILSFGAVSYIGIRRATMGIGQERLRTLTGELSTLFQQSARALTTATRSIAKGDTIVQFVSRGLQQPPASNRAAVMALQKVLDADSVTVRMELRDTAGNILLAIDQHRLGKKLIPPVNFESPARGPAAATDAIGKNPDSNFVGKFYVFGDSVFYPVVATIQASKRTVGYLVRWRSMQTTPKAIAQLSQLLGANATLYFGNTDGSVWTDMLNTVPRPPVDIHNLSAILTYDHEGLGKVIATAMPVAGTKWVIFVALSRSLILEAANRLLYWIVIVGALLVAIGMFVAWMISRSFTRRLDRLSQATAALASGDYSSPVMVDRHDELGQLAESFNTMALQVAGAHHSLEQQVKARTAELEAANKELEAFSYSVSHDLRAPLRAVSGYAMMLKEDYEHSFDAEAKRITGNIISNVKMMGRLIDDLIAFSRLGKREVARRNVDMKALTEACVTEALHGWPDGKFNIVVGDMPTCFGDEDLLKQVWINLIGNALKYSSRTGDPLIEIGHTGNNGSSTWFVRDNGAGFDMKYSDKLFKVFQRLHSHEEFEGTGIGLALVRRIIEKHRGRIWAESQPGKGAVFYFSLPEQ